MVPLIETRDGVFSVYQAALAMLVLFPLFLALLGSIVGFCIWMFVDCVRRDWPDKAIWVVAFVLSVPLYFTFWVALLYYLLIKRKNVGTPPPTPSNPPEPPAA